MKKQVWLGALLAGLMVVSAGVGAWAAVGVRQQIEVEYRSIKIEVDGALVTVDAEPFLHVEKGRTFVPARPLAEAMGAKVGWDANTSTVKVYTRTYAETRREGDQNVWTMPAHGFSVKAPPSFARAELPGGLLWLVKSDANMALEAGVNVAVMPYSQMNNKQKTDVYLGSVKGFLFTEMSALGEDTQPGYYSVLGMGKASGDVTVGWSLKLISTAQGDWFVFAVVRGDKLGDLNPSLQAIQDSFTLQ